MFANFLTLKFVTLIFATALSLLGSLGQFLLIDSWDELVSSRASELRLIESRVATLRASQNQYYNAYVQGNLLYAMDPADQSTDRGLTAKMYQVALYDRASPFRALLGELALAGLLNFKTTIDAYKALADTARADLSYGSYTAVNLFERDILDKALDYEHNLQARYLDAQSEKADAEQARDRRRLWLTIITALGTCLLLGANLMAEGKKSQI
jgi:hypothetical protein